jgi:release factor glutamine methyltransferase
VTLSLLRSAARELATEFRAAGIEEPELEAEVLVRHVAGVDRAAYFRGVSLTSEFCGRLRELGDARLRREPSAYLVGEREFYGRTFLVGPGVLIPRLETEMLVELALEELHRAPDSVVVDVGTGSGCVAVSVAAETTEGWVAGIDVSGEALAYAAANAHRLAPRTQLLAGDLLGAARRADVVLANLPYIPTAEIDALEPEVSKYEPRVALDGGSDGLDLVRALLRDCANRLRPRTLAVELGFGQAATVAAEFELVSDHVEIREDFGGIQRIVVARWG